MKRKKILALMAGIEAMLLMLVIVLMVNDAISLRVAIALMTMIGIVVSGLIIIILRKIQP